MMSFENARILDMDEITAWDGKTMWLLCRGKMAAWPVIYDHEHLPYLVFRTMVGSGLCYLKPELMKEKWVLFDRRPGADLRRRAFQEWKKAKDERKTV